MNFKKNIFIKDLQLGDTIADLFLLANAQQLQAKNGPYWRLEFKDASGAIGGKIWSPQSAIYPSLNAGQIVFVSGRIGKYREVTELLIDSMQILSQEETDSLAMHDFLSCSQYNPTLMLQELQEILLQNLTYKPWLKFTRLLLSSELIRTRFLVSPAAKNMHHAYRSGLLEHTLSVCKLCLLISQNYPEIDKQVLLIGALCHDLGKIWELEGDLHIEYTQTGKLLGHIYQGLEGLTPLMQKAGVDPELIEHAQHLIISHHGSLEFGSPKLPATAEAFVLHYADNLDSKLQQIFQALHDIEPDQTGWSQYIPALGRSLYKAPFTPLTLSADKGKKGAKESSKKQVLLEQICLLPLKE